MTSSVERLLLPVFLTVIALGGLGYAVYDAWTGDWTAMIGGIALGIAGHMLFRWVGVRHWAWLTREAVLIPAQRRTKARFSELVAIRKLGGHTVELTYLPSPRWWTFDLIRSRTRRDELEFIDRDAFLRELIHRVQDRFGAEHAENLQIP